MRLLPLIALPLLPTPAAASFFSVAVDPSRRILSSGAAVMTSTTSSLDAALSNKEAQKKKKPLSIAILGGGISGLSCASQLLSRHKQQHSSFDLEVTLFDTGRLRPGGRCSSRLVGDKPPVVKNRTSGVTPIPRPQQRRACDNDAGLLLDSNNDSTQNQDGVVTPTPENIQKALRANDNLADQQSNNNRARVLNSMGPIDHAAQIISVPKLSNEKSCSAGDGGMGQFQKQIEEWMEGGVLESFPEGSVCELLNDCRTNQLRMEALQGEMYYGKGGMGNIPLVMRDYCLTFNGFGESQLVALAGGLFVPANASKIRGTASTVALFKKAVPIKTRRLDGDNGANGVNGSYSVSFGMCVDIKTRSEDLFSEDVIDQVQAGNVLSLKSYVLFYACNDINSDGYGCTENNSDVYMVDLSTYLSAVGLKQANYRHEYCEQCEANQNICAANADAAENNDEEGQAEDQAEEGQTEDNDEQDAEEEQAQDQVEEGDEEDGEQQAQQEERDGEEEQAEDDAEDQVEEGQEEEEQEQQEERDEQQEDEQQEERDGEEQGEMEDADQDKGARKLNQIDCNQCNNLECFANQADDEQVENRDEIDTYIAEWIEQIANCKETNQYINGQQIYLGAICSEYADTFEIGAFLDKDCTIHTKLATFSNIVAAEKENYSTDVAGYAITSLKTAFYQPMTCESLEFAQGDDENNGENDVEMNDYCKQLFEDNSVNINQCAATDEEEGEQDQGDDEYYWYSYDMEDADDAEKVCAKIVSFNGEYSNHYDSAISGTVHTRDRNGNLATSESTVTFRLYVAVVSSSLK